MTMRSLVVVVAAVACGPSHDVVPIAPHNAPPKQSLAELVARAERAHTAHYSLDYKRPMERAPVDPSPATALYLDACRAGDKPSCWIALQIAQQDTLVRQPEGQARTEVSPLWHEAAKQVETNCLAGHNLSCMALPGEDDSHGRTFPTAPGAAGRSLGCRKFEPASCPQPAVRAECEAGFTRSCNALAGVLGTLSMVTSKKALWNESEALTKRLPELAAAGCRARIVEDCMHTAHDEHLELSFISRKHRCDLGRICGGVSESYLEQGDVTRARDAAERGCQYFADRCAELGVKYLDGVFPEPVPGRGQVLVDFICDSVRKSSGQEAMDRYRPCARAKLPPLDSAD